MKSFRVKMNNTHDNFVLTFIINHQSQIHHAIHQYHQRNKQHNNVTSDRSVEQ